MRRGLRIAVFVAYATGTSAWAHQVGDPIVADEPLLSAAERKVYREAFRKLDNKRFRQARTLARKAKERLPAKVIRWAELAGDRPRGSFEDLARFLDDNPHWPGQAALLRNAELLMPADLTDGRVLAWFSARPATTSAGAVRHAEALMRAGQRARATALLRASWIEMDFPRREERAFRKHYAKLLRRQDELARLERLLWEHKSRPAKRQARRLGRAYVALAEARLRLARMGPGVDRAIRRVPKELRNHPGLVYERARWRQRKGRYEDVIELLDPPNPAAPHPERWWPLRKWAARQAFFNGDISLAHRIAGAHGLEAGLGFAEGEWLAGWIALRFLAEPERAYAHFTHLNRGVTSPISLARSAYWAGEAAWAMDKRDPAGGWLDIARTRYAEAAEFGTTFYGQLAARRLGRPIGIRDERAQPPTAEARAAFDRRELVRVARMLGELGEVKLHERFLLHLKVLADSATDYALVAELAREQGRADIAVRAAKDARSDGVILYDELFPSHELAEAQSLEPALVLAVIRQESGFYDGAMSRAGARGLMQIMPRTAKRMARRIKVRYSRKRLLTDPRYNLRLGQAYLSDLSQRYGGSYVLALAAYNAGPARANGWIKIFGDPRDPDVDPVDWIESIPFDETRNYVQRTLESLVVYRRHPGVADGQPVLRRDGVALKSWARQPHPSDLSCCL